MNTIIKAFATGLGVGYLPKAPGTFGTLVGVLLFWSVSTLPLYHYMVFLVAFILFSCWVSDKAQGLFGVDDPKQVVIDEIAGYLVTMAGHAFSWKAAVIGFVLFRFFDILKPFPIGRIDDGLHNGFGIVLDDVVAGVYANICLFAVLYFL